MSRGPLSGMRVVEFTQIAAGPFAGLLLADLGADVIKVEPPEGDGMRGWPPQRPLADGAQMSLNFAALNRNKKSVVIDLKSPSGRAAGLDLAGAADVVIENYRPGVMGRLGLSLEALAERNRKIIYCSLSGYGQAGPDAHKGAFDVVIQAASGLMDITGEEGGAPAKCGVPVSDFVAGQYAALAIAVWFGTNPTRDSSVYIDCSMLESTLAISALQTSEYWGTNKPPQRLGTAHPRNAPYQAFETEDRPIIVAAGNQRLWVTMCEVIGRPDLVTDPLYLTQELRVAHHHQLQAELERELTKRPSASWAALFDEAGVPCTRLNNFAEALTLPQVAFRRFIQDVALPDGSTVPMTMLPFSVNGVNRYDLKPAPRLGQHTAALPELLRNWVSPVREGSARD